MREHTANIIAIAGVGFALIAGVLYVDMLEGDVPQQAQVIAQATSSSSSTSQFSSQPFPRSEISSTPFVSSPYSSTPISSAFSSNPISSLAPSSVSSSSRSVFSSAQSSFSTSFSQVSFSSFSFSFSQSSTSTSSRDAGEFAGQTDGGGEGGQFGGLIGGTGDEGGFGFYGGGGTFGGVTTGGAGGVPIAPGAGSAKMGVDCKTSLTQQTCVPLIQQLGASDHIVVQPLVGTFIDYFNEAVPLLMTLAVGFCVLWILIGSYKVMVSGSNGGMRTEGKNIIMWAIIGLILVNFAGFFLRTLNNIFFV